MDFITDDLRGAYFGRARSEIYRYTLWRRWSACRLAEMCAFICLNPSTADEMDDDPTCRRCIDFSKRWGFEGFIMLNLFAYRQTNPKVMMKAIEPVGIENNDVIRAVAADAGRVVLAWGNDGVHMGRAGHVLDLLKGICQPVYLKRNASGQPAHPLYLHASTKPILWDYDVKG